MGKPLNEGVYEIRKAREKHKQPKYIILSQVRNFYEFHTPLKPILRLGTSTFTWNQWQRYFYKILQRWHIPFHYFIEQIANEFSVFVGEPEQSPSYFLEEMLDAGIIPEIYRESIVVGIGEDFSIEIAEKRMYEQLCFRLLVPLQIRNAKYIDHYHIVYLDEIIDWGRYKEAVEEKKIKFDIVPSTFFHEQTLRIFYRKYRSSIRSV